MIIFQSASKIVFVLMSLGVILLTFTNKLEPKDFLLLASMCFSYYFTQNKK